MAELQRSASVDRIAELLGPDATKLLDLHLADDLER